ncbi:MAG: cell division protein FtsH [bacterium TMED198]|nr:MAG: cell division protein FtsH [bacterium TMED198]
MKKNNKNNKKNLNPIKSIGSNILLWILIVLISVTLLEYFSTDNKPKNISYSEYKDFLTTNMIESAVIEGRTFIGTLKEEVLSSDLEPNQSSYKMFKSILPEVSIDMTQSWDEKNIKYEFKDSTPSAIDYIFQFSPWILILAFWLFIMRRMQGPGAQSGIFGFSKSKAKMFMSDNPKITFKNVAGCDEAKAELKEIVDFLKKPNKYKKIGAKIPRGALLLGSPGTGKTLLAKAVSGEAGVPFFSISGAEFVEMFVGVGASRVRDLFEQAKKNSPSIIFIDEIDAVGRHRGAGLGGGHDEREQTLNQILVEMDGFNSESNVIILAATNRPDVLDKALLRPGRFDRQIVVDVPTQEGRVQILKIHSKNTPLSKDVDFNVIAKSTPGMVGADLENLINEAALLAARDNKNKISMKYLEEAKDKVQLGVARKSMVLNDEDKKIIAYHEAGHALVAYFSKYADPVHKITIVPRGMALGVTAQLPENDKFNYSKNYLISKLNVLMGGRCAEKIIFSDTTTGAGNDILVATDIAKKMVCEWGMSDKIGPLTFGKKNEEVFLGREISYPKEFSNDISKIIDEEITTFVKNAEKFASDVLKKNIDKLHAIANSLLENETISGNQMKDLILNPSPSIIDK